MYTRDVGPNRHCPVVLQVEEEYEVFEAHGSPAATTSGESSVDYDTVVPSRKENSSSTYSAPWLLSNLDAAKFKALDQKRVKLSDVPKYGRDPKLNRTMDVLPRESSRVKLAKRGIDESTQYYNGNYIRGADGSPKRYICCMGPTKQVCENFWRMVHGHEVVSVVMATGLVEKKKEKCAKYWPSAGKTVKYGPVQVQALREPVKSAGFSTRKFRVALDGVVRTVTHFWLDSWPDHGVPKNSHGKLDPTGLCGVRAAVRAHQAAERSSAPIITHCSAGVGRSGSFVAFDHALEKLELTGEVDLVKVIDEIRNDRVALVQHVSQYKFVHYALKEYIQKTQNRKKIEKKAEKFKKSDKWAGGKTYAELRGNDPLPRKPPPRPQQPPPRPSQLSPPLNSTTTTTLDSEDIYSGFDASPVYEREDEVIYGFNQPNQQVYEGSDVLELKRFLQDAGFLDFDGVIAALMDLKLDTLGLLTAISDPTIIVAKLLERKLDKHDVRLARRMFRRNVLTKWDELGEASAGGPIHRLLVAKLAHDFELDTAACKTLVSELSAAGVASVAVLFEPLKPPVARLLEAAGVGRKRRIALRRRKGFRPMFGV